MTNDMWVGVFEVTQKQWMLVVDEYPDNYDGANWHYTKNDKYPIEGVDGYYYRASKFLSKVKARSGVDVRLPSAQEWEYACRGGKTTDLNSGESLTVSNANKVAYWGLTTPGANAYQKSGSGMGKPTTVGSYAPNAWGLYDMHGNVSEHTSKYYWQVGGGNYGYCGGDYDSSLSELRPSKIVEKSTGGFRVFANVD